jgi:uncharacterized caspase-like protein
MPRAKMAVAVTRVLIGCLLLASHTAAAPQRVALVIGNAEYAIGRLSNPVHDAADMATLLRQLRFAVTVLRNANLRTMQKAVRTFSRQLRQGGTGLFYYAGHGMQVNGENYLIPLGASIDRIQDVPYEALPVGRILGAMEDAANPTNILILDACRDNPFARTWRSYRRGLAVVQAVRGSLIAYATAPGEVAYDGDGRNGLYTSYLLRYLPTPGLSVEEVFKRVRAGVVRDTKGQQVPWESSSLIGDFSFVPRSTVGVSATGGRISASQPVSGSSPTGPIDVEAQMWAMVESSAYPVDIQMYLEAYPNGRFAPLAHLKLQQLARLQASPQSKAQQVSENERDRPNATQQPQKQVASPHQIVSQPMQVGRLEPEALQHGQHMGRWVKYDNGTALDTKTNLMWMSQDFRNIEGRALRDWREAVAWAAKMNRQRYGGHDDWRIPTIDEYQTLYDPHKPRLSDRGIPVGYPAVFDNQGGRWFWSNETFGEGVLSSTDTREYVRTIDFASRVISTESRINPGPYFSVRLVRNGRS